MKTLNKINKKKVSDSPLSGISDREELHEEKDFAKQTLMSEDK